MSQKTPGETMPEFLEQNIKELEQRLEALRKQKEQKEPRQVVKDYLVEKTRPRTAAPITPSPFFSKTKPDPKTKPEEKDLPDYMKDCDEKTKSTVSQLIQTAWQKGIEAAVRESRQHGPFVVDALHDALVDKLYDQLKKRKIL